MYRTPLREQVLIIVAFGIPSLILGYFSMNLSIGSGVVLDLRDVLVTLSAVMGGPAAGAITGILAGFPVADPLVDIPSYMIGGAAAGFLAEYCRKNRVWLPTAALGMGFAYLLAGALLVFFSQSEALPGLAFRSLLAIPLSILFIEVLNCRNPGLVSRGSGYSEE